MSDKYETDRLDSLDLELLQSQLEDNDNYYDNAFVILLFAVILTLLL